MRRPSALAWPLLLMTSCGSDPVVLDPGLRPESRQTHAIYGHGGLQDSAATLIVRRSEAATTLPLTLDIDLPSDAVERIDQGSTPVPEEQARFYVSGIHVDLDGDGELCPGADLEQDYEATPYDSFGPDEVPDSLVVTMKPFSLTGCEPFPADHDP